MRLLIRSFLALLFATLASAPLGAEESEWSEEESKRAKADVRHRLWLLADDAKIIAQDVKGSVSGDPKCKRLQDLANQVYAGVVQLKHGVSDRSRDYLRLYIELVAMKLVPNFVHLSREYRMDSSCSRGGAKRQRERLDRLKRNLQPLVRDLVEHGAPLDKAVDESLEFSDSVKQ